MSEKYSRRMEAMFNVLNDWLDLDQSTFEKLWAELDQAARVEDPDPITVLVLLNEDNVISDIYLDEETAERELHWVNNMTDEAKRLKAYGKTDFYRLLPYTVVQ